MLCDRSKEKAYFPLSGPVPALISSSDKLTSRSSSRRQRVETPMQLWLVNTPYSVTESEGSHQNSSFTTLRLTKCGVFTYVLVALDVLQDGPLLVIPVISSLSVCLELLDSSGGGPARADPVHRGRDSLAEPRLNGP